MSPARALPWSHLAARNVEPARLPCGVLVRRVPRGSKVMAWWRAW